MINNSNYISKSDDPFISGSSTYIEVVKRQVAARPDHTVYRFLNDGENESESLTYQQLETRAKAIVVKLTKHCKKNDKVLLLFQPGLSYVSSLFACFYGGFVAIPAYPPRRNRGLDRIKTIIDDSEATICLVSDQVYKDIKRNLKNYKALDNLRWIIYEEIDNSISQEYTETKIAPDDVSILQYTSGSTGSPKGVLITQSNLLYNSEYIRKSFGLNKDTIGIHWLPLFHDMGLIGGILQVAFVGAINIGMPAVEFLKKPINWLKAIDKYGGTVTGGPDFAYNHCIDKINDDDASQLNLSTVEVMYCGAEPIKKSTYKNFTNKFAVSKFTEDQFYSCYGLAETTLIVTGGNRKEMPRYLQIDSDSLSKNEIEIVSETDYKGVDIVGCGHTWMDTSVKIVNHESKQKVGENKVGEVWVSGPTLATGYWKKQIETELTFFNKLDGIPNKNFLRTGDLGFMHGGELFITGRLKDLIIIRGVNYYPNDLENQIQSNIEEIRPNGGAAFSIIESGEEKLVIVQELQRSQLRENSHSEIIDNIKSIIASENEIEVHAVVLIRTGSIQLTSSGKVKRRETKLQFLAEKLDIISSWVKEEYNSINEMEIKIIEPTNDSIKEWLIYWISNNQHIKPDEIDPDKNIMTYGIDSIAAVTLETDINNHYNFNWHVSSFFLNPTINMLAEEAMTIYNEEK
jgi:acyl-CoA synthetase (AMP-forming)/AMP-acid ligase II/acyl carrier protein